MTESPRKSYREIVHSGASSRGAGQAGQALPLVRLTLALRDTAEFEAAYAGRLERDGIFVTTLRTRTAGERVRLRVELVSGGTAWSGEVVVTGAGREGGRTGFWVRRAPAPPAQPQPAPALSRTVTPPPASGPATLRLRAAVPARQPVVAPGEPEELDETSFEEVLGDDEGRAAPAVHAAPAVRATTPARAAPSIGATPPPLPPRGLAPSRPDLSAIFQDDEADDEALLEDPLAGGLSLPAAVPGGLGAPDAAAAGLDEEEWLEGGVASLEVAEEEELEDLY